MKLGSVELLMRGISNKLCSELEFFIQDIRRRMTRIFNHYSVKYRIVLTTQPISSFQVAGASSASWQTVLSNLGFNYTSFSSSLGSELVNYFDTNFTTFFLKYKV